jgi:hypothetical protein
MATSNSNGDKPTVTARQKGSKPAPHLGNDGGKKLDWEKVKAGQKRDPNITPSELISRGLFTFFYLEGKGKNSQGNWTVDFVRPINKAYSLRYPDKYKQVAADKGRTEEQLLKMWPMTRQIVSKVLTGAQRTIDWEPLEAIAAFRHWQFDELIGYLIDKGIEDVRANGEEVPPLITSAAATAYLVIDTVESKLEDMQQTIDHLRGFLIDQDSQLDSLQDIIQWYRREWDDAEILAALPEESKIDRAMLGKFASGAREPDNDDLDCLYIAFNALEKSLPESDLRLAPSRKTLQMMRDKFVPKSLEDEELKITDRSTPQKSMACRPPMI